jgi:hypothetical protein
MWPDLRIRKSSHGFSAKLRLDWAEATNIRAALSMAGSHATTRRQATRAEPMPGSPAH